MNSPGEYEEEYPPVDSGFYSVYSPDDYDDEWGTWDTSFSPEDNAYRRPDFYCHYDYEQHKWVCDCAHFIRYNNCKHSYQYRGTVNVPVSERYL